jgi:hypothetical protein
MAARTSIVAAADVTVESTFEFGGQSGKKRKMATLVIDGSTSTASVDEPWNFGSTDGDILASVLGFKKIDWCSNLTIFTTATGATLRFVFAGPSLNGTGILLGEIASGVGSVYDIALSYVESARITVVGTLLDRSHT